jgi:hypothetical protein
MLSWVIVTGKGRPRNADGDGGIQTCRVFCERVEYALVGQKRVVLQLGMGWDINKLLRNVT